MRNLVGISDEVYAAMSRYSFMFFLLIMRSQAVGEFLSMITNSAVIMFGVPFGFHLYVS
jgi:hypothetical protein